MNKYLNRNKMNAQTFNNISTVKLKVHLLLDKYEHLKDSDEKLIATFWYHEIGGANFSTMTAHDLLKKFSEGKLTSTESIRRCRQKLQEENENLRGKMYTNRKSDGEVIRTKIHQL
jgi:hypothetical protein